MPTYRHIKYRPWVGKNYFDAPTRILFVGVKHYSDDPLSVSPDATTECVNYYLNDDEYEHYFDAFDKVIEVIKDDGLSNKDAWSNIAFYNYTQEVLPDKTSIPTQQQIAESKDAYIELLERLRPHKIIFWGKWMYDQVLVGYGVESQRIDGHETWMIDMHQLCEEVAENEHILHVTYINDPTGRDFRIRKFRELMRTFISQQPIQYSNPHIKRRVVQLMRTLQIDVDGYHFNGLDFSDVLSKAIASGILHFNPPAGVIDNLRLTADTPFATSYFAHCMRDAMKCDSATATQEESARHAISELMNDERYGISISDDGLEIKFRGKTKSRVKQMFEALVSARHGNMRKKIPWEVFEKIFDKKNIRQDGKHIGKSKEYAIEIDEFFRQ